ncbi:MAG: histidine phosphatase family protein [Cyanobacteriota bacterium]
MPLRIVLVRHGLSSFNIEKRIQGRDDLSSLTETGQDQARRTGQALAGLTLDAVYSSPLRRAAETARLLLQTQGSGLAMQLETDRREIDLTPWTGLTPSDLAERDPAGLALWKQAPERLRLERPDGSDYSPLGELMEQAQRFLETLLQRHGGRDQTVLVVAHNAILRALLLQLLGLPIDHFRRLRVDNASLSVLNLLPPPAGAAQPYAIQIESLHGVSHLGTALPAPGTGSRILLVRHGETDWNRQGRFQGQIDIPLNSNGWSQARAAGSFLADTRIDRAYSSSMARPRQTAEAILASHPGVPLTTLKGLVEIGHGLWEGCLESEIAEGWPQLLADWKRAPETVQMPEGETIQQVWDRAMDTWHRIVASLAPGETALVVAHDAVNKAILCALLGLTPGDIWAIKQGNGGVTVIDQPQETGGSATVTSLNITAHLGGVLDRTAAGAL